ncbi:hypothetical protein BD289DRAFT_441501 [Coniella lustricola]|uniref:Uncharacterized protein n=1 Tax=Coniella lustricola TaxID=2025994 RepID=A0A2T2ZZD5_9PEZI|nr:hypothetical protein BD289DRAFT_441501 [Coniella lustricola]
MIARRDTRSYLWPLVFTGLGGLGLWCMRIEPAIHGVPLDFEQHVQAARLSDGSRLRTTYTGLAPVDQTLSFLVLAFADGAFGFDPAVKLQHLHFLLNFFSLICIWNVEAYRLQNSNKSIRFPGTWAIFYQTIAGAAVVPLYYAAWFFPSSSAASSSTTTSKSARDKESLEVPLTKAKAILPSAIIFYLIPTLTMYLIFQNNTTTAAWTKQGLIAYWQFSPIFVSAAIPLISQLVSSRASRHLSTDHHLKRIYTVAFGLSALAHFYVFFVCYTTTQSNRGANSSNSHGDPTVAAAPPLTLYRVFVPDRTLWRESLTGGLHYIFQCDWWVIYAASLLWSCVVATDVQCNAANKTHGQKDRSSEARLLAANLVKIVGLAALFGPGAALAAVWWWKEEAERDSMLRLRTT